MEEVVKRRPFVVSNFQIAKNIARENIFTRDQIKFLKPITLNVFKLETGFFVVVVVVFCHYLKVGSNMAQTDSSAIYLLIASVIR